MADNVQGQHVQGCTEVGDACTDERPVSVAGCDTVTGKKAELPITGQTVPVTVVSGGGGPVTIADCADVTQGCIADAAVTGDNPGTISAKLRGLNKILFDVWDSVNHFLKVSVGNFPANQTVSGTVTANQGTPNSVGNSWPVEVTDGTNVLGTAAHPIRNDPTGTTKQPVTIADGDSVALGATTDAAVVTDANGTVSGKLRGLVKIFADVWDSTNHWLQVLSTYRFGNKVTYSAGSGPTGSGTVANTENSNTYLFRGAGDNIRRQINSIDISFGCGSAGNLAIRICRITAENGTPGGTTATPSKHDSSDGASVAVFRWGAAAPTREATDVVSLIMSGSTNGIYTLTAADFPEGKPLLMRANVAEGWEVRTKVLATITTAVQVSCNFHWTEG